MNNKTMMEFGFRTMWRIILISEAVIHRGSLELHNFLHNNSASFNNFWIDNEGYS